MENWGTGEIKLFALSSVHRLILPATAKNSQQHQEEVDKIQI